LSLFNKSFQKEDIEVIGLVYNQNNNLLGVGKTKVFLNPQEVKDIFVFLPELLTSPAGFEIYLQR
jgi:hypothetical protein